MTPTAKSLKTGEIVKIPRRDPAPKKTHVAAYPSRAFHGNGEIVCVESIEVTAARLGIDLSAIRAAQAANNA